MISRALTVLLAMFGCCAAALLPGTAHAAELDSGDYDIYLHGRMMGKENFYIDQYADSIIVDTESRILVRTPFGEDTLKKTVRLHVDPFDLNLRDYQSTQTIGKSKVGRRLEMLDTSFTAFRDEDGNGSIEVLVRPPGRIYLHDPDVYVLFDVIARNLHRQTFDSRPILLMVLSIRDTTLEINATKLGVEPLRWGTRTVQANKLELSDGTNRLLIWSDSRGRMLVFENPASGLRVVREPPAVKKAPVKKPTVTKTPANKKLSG